MANLYDDDIATGMPDRAELQILGRLREGQTQKLVLLEEPGDPVLMHYRRGNLFPHFKRNCPDCLPTDMPKPLWYVGGSTITGEEGIVELTYKCFRAAEVHARRIGRDDEQLDLPPVFSGLLIVVSRSTAKASPRVLRCEQRVVITKPWSHHTRRELARIWNVPIRPRLFNQEQA